MQTHSMPAGGTVLPYAHAIATQTAYESAALDRGGLLHDMRSHPRLAVYVAQQPAVMLMRSRNQPALDFMVDYLEGHGIWAE